MEKYKKFQTVRLIETVRLGAEKFFGVRTVRLIENFWKTSKQ